MEIDIQQGASDVTRVAVRGSLDGLTAEAFEERLAAELGGGRVRMVVDLARVDYLSSAGLRSLLATVKSARSRGGDLRLAAGAPDVLRVLELAGFLSILKHFDALDEAVGSYAE